MTSPQSGPKVERRTPGESERIGRYAIDHEFEAILSGANDRLSTLEAELVRDVPRPDRPLVVVCGAPRSGTTLVAQLLARSRSFYYVNNFMARFWRAPYFAGLLDRRLGIREAALPETVRSAYGVTVGPNEPHEFGFFWNTWLRFAGETHRVALEAMTPEECDGLRAELWGLMSLSTLPFFIKNNIVGLNAAAMVDLFDDVRFVVLRRDPLFIAQSIHEARVEMLGTPEVFWSLRPSTYAEIRSLDPPDQIARQIADIYGDIETDLARTGARHVVLSYEEVCRDPAGAVAAVGRLAGAPLDDVQLSRLGKDLRVRNERRLPSALLNRLSSALRGAGL